MRCGSPALCPLIVVVLLLFLVVGKWGLADRLLSLHLVEVVDVHGRNVLVRMGNPATYWPLFLGPPQVSESDLDVAMRAAAARDGRAFPEAGSYDLVDVSLLIAELALDEAILRAEREAMGARLVHWVLQGVSADGFRSVCGSLGVAGCTEARQPGVLQPASVRVLAANFSGPHGWDSDRLHGRIETLRHLITSGGERPRVVFFHCACGCDRTGLMFMAYAMRYLDMSYTQAVEQNERLIGRHQVYKYQISAQWYCESLRIAGHYTQDDCGQCGPPGRCADSGGLLFDAQVLGITKNIALIVFVAALLCILVLCWCCLHRRQRLQHDGIGGSYAMLKP